MKIKYKILFILIFVVCSLFLLNSDSFASDENTITFVKDDITYILPSISEYINTRPNCPYFFSIYRSSGTGGTSYYYIQLLIARNCEGITSFTENDLSSGEIGFFTRTLSISYSSSIHDYSSAVWGYEAISYPIFFGSGNKNHTLLGSSVNILNVDGSVVFSSNISNELALKYPFVTNSNQVLETGNFDYLCINSADFYGEKWQDFYLLAYDYSSEDEEQGIITAYPRNEILITRDSIYYTNDYDNSYIFMIPFRCFRYKL